MLVTVLGGTVSKSDQASPLGIYLSTGRISGNVTSSHGDGEEMTFELSGMLRLCDCWAKHAPGGGRARVNTPK